MQGNLEALFSLRKVGAGLVEGGQHAHSAAARGIVCGRGSSESHLARPPASSQQHAHNLLMALFSSHQHRAGAICIRPARICPVLLQQQAHHRSATPKGRQHQRRVFGTLRRGVRVGAGLQQEPSSLQPAGQGSAVDGQKAILARSQEQGPATAAGRQQLAQCRCIAGCRSGVQGGHSSPFWQAGADRNPSNFLSQKCSSDQNCRGSRLRTNPSSTSEG